MASRHLGKPESTRVPEETSNAAHAALAARGWTVHAFLAACLAALVAEPDRILAVVAKHRPLGKKTGRPKRADDATEVTSRTVSVVESPAFVAPAEADPAPPSAPVTKSWAGRPQIPFRR